MPVISNAAVDLTAREGYFMPDTYNKVDIYLTEEIRRRIRIIRDYLVQVVDRNPAGLYARHSLDDRYARNTEFGCNVSSLVDACIRKLLYDLDQNGVVLGELNGMAAAYYDDDRTARLTIALDDNAIEETERIFRHFERMGIRINPISKRGVLNRKMPISLALAHCYHFIEKLQLN